MIHHFNRASDLNLTNYSEREIISSWFRLAYKNQMAVALWRLPGACEKHLVVDTSEKLSVGKVDLEETTGGFVVAPFENPDRCNDILLKAHIYYNSNQHQIKVSNEPEAIRSGLILDQLPAELESGIPIPLLNSGTLPHPTTSESQYKSTVEYALNEIRQGTLQKVVPSVSRQVELGNGFNCLDTFDRLCASYPTAFISLVTAPELGTWVCASPEPIIEVDKSKIFTTAALAGTQAYVPGTPLQEVAWKQKEIEEQALVSRYIINCFKKIRLREFEEIGPKTIIAGNLLHLKTTYTVDMEETNFPLLGSVMLDLLHPTSAVCGMPKTPAQAFIKEKENFDREFFSGYLGPVNMNEETHLFVNLRCMKIGKEQATLYAGAGVTEDSIPYSEWVETQLKCDTLLDVLDQ